MSTGAGAIQIGKHKLVSARGRPVCTVVIYGNPTLPTVFSNVSKHLLVAWESFPAARYVWMPGCTNDTFLQPLGQPGAGYFEAK